MENASAKADVSLLREQMNLSVAHLRARRWTDAESVLRQILAQHSDDPEAHFQLGQALRHQGRLEEALSEFAAAVELRPGAGVYSHMGDTLRQMKRPAQAIAAFQKSLELKPDSPQVWNNFGVVLLESNHLVGALEAFRKSLALQNNNPDAFNNLGIVLTELRRPAEAIEAYRWAVKMRPKYVEAWTNLGGLLYQAKRSNEAIAVFRQAVELRPDFALAWSNLAGAYRDTGQLEEALRCVDRAIALNPADVVAQGQRLSTLYFHPAYDSAAIFRASREWNERFARPLAGEIPVHRNDPSPGRRLRIGYVSQDFCCHCEAMFTIPLLSNHHHDSFEIFCFSSVPTPDAVTAAIKRHADQWRDISSMTDAEAAQLITREGIDILVDLALHTARNRLGIFARKPAPVQVTWLGYPGTTGMDTIDYRLTDERLDPLGSNEPEIRNPKSEIRINDPNPNDPNPNDPNLPSAIKQPGSLRHSDIGKLTSASSVEPGFDSDFGLRASDFATKEPNYSELSIRLPDSFWCYDPTGMGEKQLPEPGPLPALTAGHVTFGCLNNFCKVSDRALQLWAGALAAVPSARLLLFVPPGPQRDRLPAKLGVHPRRLELVAFQPWRQYLETYRRIDISLDTLPFNGGTTSLDSLWMGVPVVTRVGATVIGRAGLSHLHLLGLTECIAHSDEDFTARAAALADDVDRLAGLRATLRRRMEQSPLMDAPRFAGNMEAAYRRMWQAWCAARSQPA